MVAVKVLVFGAGSAQVPFIQALVRGGASVTVIGETIDQLVPDDVGRIQVSTHDVSAVLRAVADSPRAGFDAIACPTPGRSLISAAATAHVLGLGARFASESVARMLTTRVELHQALLVAGLARRFIREVDAVVIKPRSMSGGSRGISIHRDVVIEDHVAGPEWKLIGMIVHGRPHLWSCVGIRDSGASPIALVLGGARPTWDNTALLAGVSALVSDLGLHDGPIQLDVIDSTDGPEVIDLDLVLGGAGPLIRAATGVDLDAAYADLVLGRDPALEPTRDLAAAMSYPDRRIVTAATALAALEALVTDRA